MWTRSKQRTHRVSNVDVGAIGHFRDGGIQVHDVARLPTGAQMG